MKKNVVLVVLVSVLLCSFSGCRSAEIPQTFVSEPSVQFIPEDRPAEPEAVIEEADFEPSVSVTPAIEEYEEPTPAVEETAEEAPEPFIVYESVQDQVEPVEISIVKSSPAGLIILIIVAGTALLSFLYYFFIFRKKVSQ